MVQDSTGRLWFISENNLFWFDGTRFSKIEKGNGTHEVPGNIYYQLYRSPENEIWIIYKKGFSIYRPATHSFTHFTGMTAARNNEGYHLLSEYGDDLIFASQSSTYKINRINKKLQGFTIHNVMNPTGNIYNIQIQKGFFATQSNRKTTLQFYRKYPPFTLPDSTVNGSGIYRFNDSLIVCGNRNSLKLYSLHSGIEIANVAYPFQTPLQTFDRPTDIIQKNPEELVVFLESEIWRFNLKQLAFTQKIGNSSGNNFFKLGYFKKGMCDRNGNLWASSNINGLSKISFGTAPIHAIGSNEMDEIFVKCLRVNKPYNSILLGTYGNGLMLYDTIGTLKKHFLLQQENKEVKPIVSSIGQIDSVRYLIFLFQDPRQYELNVKTLNLKAISLDKIWTPGYNAEMIEIGNGEILYPTRNGGYYKISWQMGKPVVSNTGEADIQKLIAHGQFNVQQTAMPVLDGRSYFDAFQKWLPVSESGRLVIKKRGKHWLFGTFAGIYEMDAQANLVNKYNIASGLSDEYIYAIEIDKNGDIWCSHNKGISRISGQGSILNLGKEDGLLADEYNFGASVITADNQLFFGGISGLNFFYPSQINQQMETPLLMISQISSNRGNIPTDTAFNQIKKLELPFAQNNIKIVMSAIGRHDGEYYNYQYRVKGLFEDWKNLGHAQEINLALPPGNFVLEIACGNAFNKNAVAQWSMKIFIVPPFYQRWWFIALIILAGIAISSLLVFLVQNRRKRKKYARLKLLQQVEHERRRISRDLHDNMGAYTTALLSNVEKLKLSTGPSQELDKMTDNAQQILSSLRETIWVLNNKEISVADFCDAFKNYCVKMLQHFEHIQFESEETILNNKMLHAAEAIHFDKILKEAFQNSIKHSGATQIWFKAECVNHLKLSLHDNGCGFNNETITKGNGLENMQWRAKQANAGINIIHQNHLGGSGIEIEK